MDNFDNFFIDVAQTIVDDFKPGINDLDYYNQKIKNLGYSNSFFEVDDDGNVIFNVFN